MEVLYVNNEGGGFARQVEVRADTKVADFCKVHAGIESSKDGDEFTPANWKIRVNREPVPGDYILQDGDKITVTPVKIKGA